MFLFLFVFLFRNIYSLPIFIKVYICCVGWVSLPPTLPPSVSSVWEFGGLVLGIKAETLHHPPISPETTQCTSCNLPVTLNGDSLKGSIPLAKSWDWGHIRGQNRLRKPRGKNLQMSRWNAPRLPLCCTPLVFRDVSHLRTTLLIICQSQIEWHSLICFCFVALSQHGLRSPSLSSACTVEMEQG